MHLVRLSPTGLIPALLMVLLQFPLTARVAAANYQGTLRIGGTGAALGTITQVAAAYQKQHPDVHIVIPPSLGSNGGIKAVLAGALDVGLSSRLPTEAERRQGAVAWEYARSPLLLVPAHKGAPVNFSFKEIASLYNGDIKTFPDGAPIRMVLRPEVEIDMHVVRSMSPEIDAAVTKAQSREGMLVAVTDQDNAKILENVRGAIGWITLAQIISEKLPVTPFPIENIMPSEANFVSGKYPYNRLFLVVTGAQPTPLAKSFIEFLTSAEGRAILLRNGHFVDVKKP
ncbi:MAG: substrate-binding domain-containing protein [Desulfobaccales bacterium]